MKPPSEWSMICAPCGPRFPWLRIGTTPTLCVWCGSIYTTATRVEAVIGRGSYEDGYARRDADGQRLYRALALFDRRDGSPLADIVQAAREGWERSHVDMSERDAWSDFERLIHCWNAARRRRAGG